MMNLDAVELRRRLRNRVGQAHHPVVLCLMAFMGPLALAKLYTGSPMALLAHLGDRLFLTWLFAVSTLVILVASLLNKKWAMAAVLAEMAGWSALCPALIYASVKSLALEANRLDNAVFFVTLFVGIGGLLRVASLVPVIISWYDRGAVWLTRWMRRD